MSYIKLAICLILLREFIEVWSNKIVNSSTNDNLIITNKVNLLDTSINFRSPTLTQFNKSYQLTKWETTKPNRTGKFFSSLPFLTGLGIGTLATSSVIASSGALQSPSSQSSTRLPSSTTSVNSDNDLDSAIPQRTVILPATQHYLNIYDSSHPYVALSTTLLDQSLRSIYHILEDFKNQLIQNNTTTIASTTEESKIQENTENIEEVNQEEETTNVEVYNARDDRTDIFNCSILRDVIIESIKQANYDLEQRQAEQMQQTTQLPTTLPPITIIPSTTQQIVDTTQENTSTTSSTTTPVLQINTTSNYSGYYGGNPQNIHTVDFSYPVGTTMPSSLYGQPNEIYRPPVYDHEDFHPPNYYQYHHNEYYEYPGDHSAGNSFPSNFPESWQFYPSYARSKKYSKEMKTLDRRNDFLPSNILKQL